MGTQTDWPDELVALYQTQYRGYVKLDNESSQGSDAYHVTQYGSANLVWQLRKHLSVGLEGLYGKKEVQSGATGDEPVRGGTI